MRKNFLIWAKTEEIPIWCARLPGLEIINSLNYDYSFEVCFEKKYQQTTKKHAKLPSMQRAKYCFTLFQMLASVKLLADSTETYTEEVLESIKKAFVSTETSDQLLAAELDFVSEKFISVKEES